jgi:glutamate-1-semialdehyde aminotransferase
MTDFTWHRRAQDCIAQTYLTNSKRPESLVKGAYPTHVKAGQGCYLWDQSGKRYVDFICGLGTNLLGYGNDTIATAMSAELRKGFSHSFATHHEVLAAEYIKSAIPFIDAVKFLKTGSEACSAAVKIARAKTGRNLVLSEAYHGWHDQFISLTAPAIGVPPQLSIGRLADREIDKEVAAVIVEPVVTDWSESRKEWLRSLRETCTKNGVLLIFDEVITGFRFPQFSVSRWSTITPDIIVLGKAVANGMPLAAVGGKYDVMNCGEYFISSSYAGETLSLVAAQTTLKLLQTKNEYNLDYLWRQGAAFQAKFNEVCKDVVQIEGYPTRGVLTGEPLTKAIFMQACCDAGIIFGPSWFFNFPLAAIWKDLIAPIESIAIRIRNKEIALYGELPQSPFAQKVREKQ